MIASFARHPSANAAASLAEGHVREDLAHPAAGTLEMAMRPFGASANFKPADGDE